ncbi:mitochondrial substrate carrier family protein [Striga asiatica]|uniref:Mitochondrial substrate carrier family protein n=1 Tax=Striga asiatica TaxID=4170 RepID=A0A5A7Q5C4_STRAF|nr:mitochondrial substrate carrier family protein [Striga asiatica]
MPLLSLEPQPPLPPQTTIRQHLTTALDAIEREREALMERQTQLLGKYQEFVAFFVQSSSVCITMMAGGLFIGYYLHNKVHGYIITSLVSLTYLLLLLMVILATKRLVTHMEWRAYKIDKDTKNLQVSANRCYSFVTGCPDPSPTADVVGPAAEDTAKAAAIELAITKAAAARNATAAADDSEALYEAAAAVALGASASGELSNAALRSLREKADQAQQKAENAQNEYNAALGAADAALHATMPNWRGAVDDPGTEAISHAKERARKLKASLNWSTRFAWDLFGGVVASWLLFAITLGCWINFTVLLKQVLFSSSPSTLLFTTLHSSAARISITCMEAREVERFKSLTGLDGFGLDRDVMMLHIFEDLYDVKVEAASDSVGSAGCSALGARVRVDICLPTLSSFMGPRESL